MSSTAEDPVREALQNELILEEIFSFLPMTSLHTCSLVSKNWNRQVRTYIRDHRKLTAVIHSPPCSRLRELDEIVNGMTVVPFNSLDIRLSRWGHSDCSRTGEDANGSFLYKNLISKFRLKYLSVGAYMKTQDERTEDYIEYALDVDDRIDENDEEAREGLRRVAQFYTVAQGQGDSGRAEDPTTCPAVFLLFRLLRDNSREIKHLNFKSVSPLFVRLCEKELSIQLTFPKLDEVEISDVEPWLCKGGESFLMNILRGSEKLGKITTSNGNQRILEILPESKYGLVTKFKFQEFNVQQVSPKVLRERCLKLAKSGPALIELEFWISTSETEKITRACYDMLQLLLCSSSKSLQILRIFGICQLQSLVSFPPLENLSILKLHSVIGSDKFMNDLIQPIQLGRLFPKLNTVSLESRDGQPPQIFRRYPQLETEPPEVVQDSPYTSASVKSVLLTANVCLFNFLQLKQSFPQLTELYVHPDANTHAVPYGQIFRLWPGLRKLCVSGEVTEEIYNVDAEFCGVHEDEAAYLWTVAEEDLKNMHIVPIRPCAATMTREFSFFDKCQLLQDDFA